MKLMLNPKANISQFSEANCEKRWLYCIPLINGKDYQITLPQDLHEFIMCFKFSHSFEQVFKELESLTPKNQEHYQKLIKDFLIPKGILLSEESNFKSPQLSKTKPEHMQIQMPVFSFKITNFLSFFFQYLFLRLTAIVFILFAILAQLFFYASIEPEFVNIWQLSSIEQVEVILIVGSGLFFHELGHAAAAYKFGCRKVELGLGWYICFLVFYAELSESWRLPRKQRVVIDCGGMYFQSIFTTILIILHYKTGSAVLFYSIVMLNISFIWNLNPFFRMDGYWIASDILGIANLRETAKGEFNRLFHKLFNKEYIFKSNLSPRAKNLLLIYTLTSNIFFCYMVYFLGSRLIITLNETLPLKLEELKSFSFISSSILDMFVLFIGGVFQIILLIFFSVFLYQSSRSALKFIIKISATFKNS